MKQTSASEPVDPQRQRDARRRSIGTLRTSKFDAVTSALTALILLLGTLVLLLAAVWMWSDSATQNAPLSQFAWGTVTHDSSPSTDFLVPEAEEVAGLKEPTMQDSLVAVTDAVSHVAGSAGAILVDLTHLKGNDRSPQPNVGDGSLPRFERWQLDFVAMDLDSYATQLDHYEIELGLMGGGISGLDYACNLSNQPNLRHGDSGSEKRLYFMWSRPSPLIHFDRQLLRRAGAQLESTPGAGGLGQKREILKFIPPTLENQLAKIELEYAMARGRSVNSIAKTIFVSKSGGVGYQFVVSGQRYRKQKD